MPIMETVTSVQQDIALESPGGCESGLESAAHHAFLLVCGTVQFLMGSGEVVARKLLAVWFMAAAVDDIDHACTIQQPGVLPSSACDPPLNWQLKQTALQAFSVREPATGKRKSTIELVL